MKKRKPAKGLLVEMEEAFIPPDEYKELVGMPGVPNLDAYPDGIYVYGPKGLKKFQFFAESQIDKIKGRDH